MIAADPQPLHILRLHFFITIMKIKGLHMKHTYLTKEEIDRSYRRGAITVREVKDLLAVLNQHVKRVVRKEAARHSSVILHKVA